jgi:hypothetical protein
MRLLPVLTLCLLLASCGSDEVETGNTAVGTAAAAEDKLVMCALKGSPRFERKCMPEWTETGEGRVLVLHGPDGGFRRLLHTGDARGFVAADGAEPALIAPYGKTMIQVTIGPDRYRLPAVYEEVP